MTACLTIARCLCQKNYFVLHDCHLGEVWFMWEVVWSCKASSKLLLRVMLRMENMVRAK